MPNFDRVSAGTPVNQSPARSAGWLNAVSETTERLLNQQAGGSVLPFGPRLNDAVATVRVRNRVQTGSPAMNKDLLRGHYVQLADYRFTNTDPRKQWFNGELYASSSAMPIAILRADAKYDDQVRAQVIGVCTARVNVTSLAHTHAAAAVSEYRLQSGTSGAAQLLDLPSTTGEHELPVLLGAGSGGGGMIETDLVFARSSGIINPASDWDFASAGTGVADIIDDDGTVVETVFVKNRYFNGIPDETPLFIQPIGDGNYKIINAGCQVGLSGE